MKAGVLFVAIFAVALLIIPLIALDLEPAPPAAVHNPIQAQSAVGPVVEEAPQVLSPQQEALEQHDEPETVTVAEAEPEISVNGVAEFRILDLSTGKVERVPVRDYVRGAVASEMPVSFHTEALKAQAVAAHTYALHHHYAQQANPDPALKGADFSADPSKRKGYMTEKTARAFYGEPYAEVYWDKICTAADAVLPYIMEYEEEPIVAAYHAISAGVTEAAGNVWSGTADYLVPADSEGDLLAPGYEVEEHFSAEEVRSLILAAYPEAELSGEPRGWFDNIIRSESGYITQVEVGGVPLHGKEIRALFDLRSHNIEIACTDSGFTLTTHGYGHGVGLSQYGADFLARQGYTFDRILENYYQGVTLKVVEFEER